MRARILMVGLTGLVLAAATPMAAQAQTPQTREGFWFNGGLGVGSLGCAGCDGRLSGGAGALAVGGKLSDQVLLGASSNLWTRSEDGATLTVGTVAAVVRYYTSPTGGFFLLGGAGIGSLDAELAGFGSATETGFGLIGGLGYDFRVARMVSLTPFWNGVAVRAADETWNFGQFGLSITVH
jgi:hypothetical protein